MSKVILVMDEMPNKCSDCRLTEFGYRRVCSACSEKTIDGSGNVNVFPINLDAETKPNWCPLKEAPEKYEQKDWEYPDDEYFADGYNKCVDDILESFNWGFKGW